MRPPPAPGLLIVAFLVWLCFALAMADVVISGGGLLGLAFAAIGALLFVVGVVLAVRAARERRRHFWRTAPDTRVRLEHQRL